MFIPVNVVVRLEGEVIAAVTGPDDPFQLVVLDRSAPPLPAAAPLRVIELVGSVIDGSPPALTVGAAAPAPFTTTVTVAVFVAQLLSVTVKLKTYVPATSPESRVDS